MNRRWCRFPFLFCSQLRELVHYLILLLTRADYSSHCHPGIISLFYWYQLSHSIHHNSPIMWWKMNRQNYTSNIVYWDEWHQMFYPSSCLFMDFFTQGGSSSITPRNICFIIPIGLWVTEPEGFHCPEIYTFVQRTICFEQIEYQPRHLDNTQINIKTQGRMILAYNEGINEVLSANN